MVTNVPDPAEPSTADSAMSVVDAADDAATYDLVVRRTGRRLKFRAIIGIAVAALLTVLATTQLWWTIDIPGKSIDVLGTDASPSLSALALAGLALAAALGIAGPVFRVILGVLQTLIGLTVVLAAFSSISRPKESSSTLITSATGVAGEKSLNAIVEAIQFTAWPWVAILGGLLALLTGVFILATFRRWPAASRKYSAVRVEDPSAPRDSVGDWDALSDGGDPTETSAERAESDEPDQPSR